MTKKIYEIEQEKNKDISKNKFHFFLQLFLQLVKKIINFLNSKKSEKLKHDSLINSAVELKNCLKELQIKDISTNIEFSKKFAQAWKKILKVQFLIKDHNLKKIIDEFESFPENAEFSLSYYLKNSQKENSILHAYTKMIQMLHLNYQENIEKSYLKKWVSLLNRILTA
jgi:hypothetical protein